MEAFGRKRIITLIALLALVGALSFCSASFGTYAAVRAPEVLQVLAARIGLGGGNLEATVQTTVMDLRLPRVALAILAGAALAMAGAALQGLFRNPLADPALIGVSSGASLGAVFMIVLGGGALGGVVQALGAFALPVAAMAGAMLVTFLIYRLSKVEGRTHIALMLLTGLALNALAGAGIGTMISRSSDDQLRTWTYWSLGSLGKADWRQIGVAALFIIPCLIALPWFARSLNALLLGEAEAHHLGVPIQHVKRWVILLSAAMVGAAVAACGTIGFVGLVAPHLVRLVCGPDHRLLLPASALLGSSLLLAADLAARNGGMGVDELPIGVVTALVGAPVFLALLLRARRKGEF